MVAPQPASNPNAEKPTLGLGMARYSEAALASKRTCPDSRENEVGCSDLGSNAPPQIVVQDALKSTTKSADGPQAFWPGL
jgi:hypothetical protein